VSIIRPAGCCKQRWKRLANKGRLQQCHGFSLLEVLIAAVVFSFGLAGVAALLLSAIGGSAQARHEGMVAIAAANLAEQLRLNPTASDRYVNPPKVISRLCQQATPCTPAQQADYDYALWRLQLTDNIPSATGLVCQDTTPKDGTSGNTQCDGVGPMVIKIFWSGPAAAGQTENQHRFTLVAG